MPAEAKLLSIEGGGDNLLLDVDRRIIRKQFAIEVRTLVKDVRDRLKGSAGGGSGRLYYNSGGRHGDKPGYVKKRQRASSAGQLPARVTGSMLRSVRGIAWRDGNGGTVAIQAFYSRLLTFGTQSIDPRAPVLENALGDGSGGIVARVTLRAAEAFQVRRK
jgi:hypothetical protein